jgi:AcrR family transcriptional regulator
MARVSSKAVVVRRTQQERRDDTQRKLLDATLMCLSELGYARSTTTEIVRAAGVSQGALFQHFPTKTRLLSAAVAHLFDQVVHDYQHAFVALPRGTATADAAFELLWTMFTGRRLTVAFELYVVARTEPSLREALEPVLRRHREGLVVLARQLFPAAAQARPDFAAWVDLLMCSMEGLVIESYGAGNVTAPALSLLKTLMLSLLKERDGRDLREYSGTEDGGQLPWTP